MVTKSVKLGDRNVARIGLGTNQLTTTRDNVAFIRAAVGAGVQMIDTAHLYTGGQSEETIGQALSPSPEGVIVATKGGFGPGEGNPDVLSKQIDQSLHRLRAESIFLYYLHRVHPDTPIEDSLAAIKAHQDGGKIQHIGISEVNVEQIERARKVVAIVAVQNHYNLTERKYEDVVDYCEHEGIVFVPFFPLRGDGGRTLGDIAKRRGVSPRQVTLAWLLRRSPVMLPIPGSLSLEHVNENLAAANIELTDQEFAALR